MDSFQSTSSLTAVFMKLSPLTSMHHSLWFSSFSMAFPPQSPPKGPLLCSPLKDWYPHHFWAGASHIRICSPVPSPALMSSTSDCFLDTLSVSLRYIKLQVFVVECIISSSSTPAPLPVSAAQLPTLMILRTSLRPGVTLDSLHLSPSPYPDNCTSQVFL